MVGRLLSTTEATRLAGGVLTREQIVRRLQTREIRGEMIAGRWLLPAPAFIQYLARSRRGAQRPATAAGAR